MKSETKFRGRLFDLGADSYAPLFNDLIKSLTIIGVIEFAQRYVLPERYLDAVYIYMMLFIMVGQVVYHLIMNKLIGAGPPSTISSPFLGLMEKRESDTSTPVIKRTGMTGEVIIQKDQNRQEEPPTVDTPNDEYYISSNEPAPMESSVSWWN